MTTSASRTTADEETRPAAGPTSRADQSGPADAPATPERRLRVGGAEPWVASAVWLATAPIAFFLPYYTDLDPFGHRAPGLALAAALAAVALGTAVALRWPWRIWPAVAAGLLATWTVLTLRLALDGTPFGFAGMQHDAGRINAMATRYTQTWATADAWIPGLPGEYPPLYFLLTGRLAALLDMPAWRLLPDVAVLVASATVLVVFLLWRRMVPAWIALAVAALAVLTYVDPRKPYESISLAIFVPWVLLTFGRPPRGRLHWLPAGVLGAVMATTYQAWLAFGALGAAVLAFLTWRAAADRRAYLRHLAGVLLVMAVLSAWYYVPYYWGVLTEDSKMIADEYIFPNLLRGFFPFLEPTPLGVLQFVGLAGLVWFRRSAWWATPLLALAAGTLAFRLLAVIRYVVTQHTSFMHYSATLVVATLSVAGVLVVWHAARRAVEVLPLHPPAGVAAASLALLLCWSTYTAGLNWMPAADRPASYVTQAHLEPLPDGQYPRFAPADNRIEWFPVGPIEQAVTSALGPNPQRVSLSTDERLYSFLPWPGYTTISRNASGTLALWDARLAEIRRLAATDDPNEFARASATTAFGPIDIFVLRDENGAWTWRNVSFRPGQFDSAAWVVFEDLPQDIVVAVRR